MIALNELKSSFHLLSKTFNFFLLTPPLAIPVLYYEVPPVLPDPPDRGGGLPVGLALQGRVLALGHSQVGAGVVGVDVGGHWRKRKMGLRADWECILRYLLFSSYRIDCCKSEN